MSFTDKMLGAVNSVARYKQAEDRRMQTLQTSQSASELAQKRKEYLQQRTLESEANTKLKNAKAIEKEIRNREAKKKKNKELKEQNEKSKMEYRDSLARKNEAQARNLELKNKKMNKSMKEEAKNNGNN